MYVYVYCFPISDLETKECACISLLGWQGRPVITLKGMAIFFNQWQ